MMLMSVMRGTDLALVEHSEMVAVALSLVMLMPKTVKDVGAILIAMNLKRLIGMNLERLMSMMMMLVMSMMMMSVMRGTDLALVEHSEMVAVALSLVMLMPKTVKDVGAILIAMNLKRLIG